MATELNGTTVVELQTALRAVEPGALLVEARVIRRIIREQRGITRITSHVPHTHAAAVDRETLRTLVDPDELSVSLDALPAWVYLLAEPHEDALSDRSRRALLGELWRRLFHARIDGELLIRTRGVSLPRARVLELIDTIGQTPFDEARAVLFDEDLITRPSSATQDLCELVALYLELFYFQPELLPHTFPALTGRDDLHALLVDLVDGDALFATTRPDGALSPDAERAAAAVVDAAATAERSDGPRPPVSARRARSLIAGARDVERRGNDALAATRFAAAATTADPDVAAAAGADRDRALARLADRLAAMVGPEETPPQAWLDALNPLVERAESGMKRVEARLLHDLQAACVEFEGEAWGVDLGRWLRAFGRKRLRRELPCQRLVNVARDLKSAKRRVVAARLDEVTHRALTDVLGRATRVATRRLRDELGERIIKGLADARLRPVGVLEEVAHDKLVAELLDRVLDRGFIAFGDVRDAIARNQLKLRDLDGVSELLSGDALLRIDRALGRLLDTAYRRGEVYRRELQRLSSLAFATVVGRLLVRFVILPFGSAFVLLEGAQHIVGPLIKLGTGSMPQIFSWVGFAVIGVFLFGLLHAPPFRRVVVEALYAFGDALKLLFVRLPKAVMALPVVTWLTNTQAWLLWRRVVWRPLTMAWIPALIAGLIAWDAEFGLIVGACTWAGLAVFFNTRRGQRVEEALQDGAIRAWSALRHNILPGLVEVTMAFFKRFLELVEIVLYAVDQWLRFRRGENRVVLIAKAIFGLIWAMFAYVVRLYVNLLVEPQVNPIKHFPVVTVSHKMILPMLPMITTVMVEWLAFLGPVVANTIAVATVFLLPGVFGFLVWEFKETWRLYQANRRATLRPVVVGSHGETVSKLLRPGFHSGTVPKHFRKLRRAERNGRAGDARRHQAALHHDADAIVRFVERDLLRLLDRFSETALHGLRVADVELTPYRIAITIAAPDADAAPLVLHFDEQSGFLVATLARRGWLDAMAAPARSRFETALLGLYKLAGVDLVREQITSILPGQPPYDVAEEGLIVWPGDGYETEARYPLRARRPMLRPTVDGPDADRLQMPPIAALDLVFSRRPLPRPRWEAAWADVGDDPDPLRDLFGPLSVLDDDSLGNASVGVPAPRVAPAAP